MRRSARFGLRFLAFVAIVGLVPMMIHSPGTAPGPYLSALSAVTVSQTLAASNCNGKGCAGGSRHNIVCAKVTGLSNCFTYQGYCIAQNCPP